MEQYAWILWAILGVLLIVAEMFTLGFVLFWFGMGALAAAAVALFGFGFLWQFLAFALVSAALTFLTRTIFANYFSHTDENRVRTGIDALPGQIGTVTSPSSGTLHESAVKVFGSTWTAFPEEGESPLTEGERVEIVRVKGASLFVRRVKELRGWQDS